MVLYQVCSNHADLAINEDLMTTFVNFYDHYGKFFYSETAGANEPKFLWQVLGMVLYQVCSIRADLTINEDLMTTFVNFYDHFGKFL